MADRHGAGLELITGTEREVLAAIRARWPTLPIDHLPFAIETEGTNGHGNPAAVPVRVALGPRGEGQWLAVAVDERGVPLEAITGTRQEVLATIRRRWPDLPLQWVAFETETENPAGEPVRVEVTYTGRGQFSAFVLDEQGRELERFQADSLAGVRALLREHYPGLPVKVMPLRNPAAAGWRKESTISDRAHRYRANADPPPGPRICAFCGSTRNVEVGHVDGHEEHGGRDNLAWSCRSCNVIVGNVLRRAGLGRLTHQLNPAAKGATSLGQWLTAVLSMRGASDAMTVPDAVAMIRATPPEERSQFAREIWRRRREHFGPAGRPAVVPFQECAVRTKPVRAADGVAFGEVRYAQR